MKETFRKFGRKFFDSLGKNRLFFSRGYQIYFAIVLSLYSTSILTYNFVIIDNPFMSRIFKSFTTFVLTFIIMLIFFCIIFGRFDYRKGTYKEEVLTVMKYNPIWQRVFKEFKDLKEDVEDFKDLKEEVRELKELVKRLVELEK